MQRAYLRNEYSFKIPYGIKKLILRYCDEENITMDLFFQEVIEKFNKLRPSRFICGKRRYIPKESKLIDKIEFTISDQHILETFVDACHNYDINEINALISLTMDKLSKKYKDKAIEPLVEIITSIDAYKSRVESKSYRFKVHIEKKYHDMFDNKIKEAKTTKKALLYTFVEDSLKEYFRHGELYTPCWFKYHTEPNEEVVTSSFTMDNNIYELCKRIAAIEGKPTTHIIRLAITRGVLGLGDVRE